MPLLSHVIKVRQYQSATRSMCLRFRALHGCNAWSIQLYTTLLLFACEATGLSFLGRYKLYRHTLALLLMQLHSVDGSCFCLALLALQHPTFFVSAA